MSTGKDQTLPAFLVNYSLLLDNGMRMAVVIAPVERKGEKYYRLMTAFTDPEAEVKDWLRKRGLILNEGVSGHSLKAGKTGPEASRRPAAPR